MEKNFLKWICTLSKKIKSMNSYYGKNRAYSPLRGGAGCVSALQRMYWVYYEMVLDVKNPLHGRFGILWDMAWMHKSPSQEMLGAAEITHNFSQESSKEPQSHPRTSGWKLVPGFLSILHSFKNKNKGFTSWRLIHLGVAQEGQPSTSRHIHNFHFQMCRNSKLFYSTNHQ